MTKLLLNAKVDGYKVQYGDNVLSTKLEGGPARYRLDKIGDPHIASIQFVLTAQAYRYLMAFFRTELQFGVLPFEIDLRAVDTDALTTYSAHFMPGTLQLTGLIGEVYTVNAQLELIPLTTDAEADEALIAGGPGE
jgi:hypothetical protein